MSVADDDGGTITARVPPAYQEAVDRAVDAGEFPNRSEAIRYAVREVFVDAE